jgi:hypothetical protein
MRIARMLFASVIARLIRWNGKMRFCDRDEEEKVDELDFKSVQLGLEVRRMKLSLS